MISHIGEEAQLLSEEKWIIATLNKIKNERNALMIERLHLESMKMQLTKTFQENPLPKEEIENISKASAFELMQNLSNNINMYERQQEGAMQDEACNFEELNLSVANPMFGNEKDNLIQMEEEEDEEYDYESYDNVRLDMDVFMNGQ